MKLTFLVVIAFFAIFVFVIYSPVIYQYIRVLISEKRFQRELQAIKDGCLFEESRIVITEPLGTGTEPSGKISFADAMENQEFAMNTIMKLINGLMR